MTTPDRLIVLYEDGDFIGINKRTGLLVVPDRFNRFAPNLSDTLKKQYSEIFVVHRLDKETSGVVICAKNADAH